MAGRQTREAIEALALVLRTGCTPAEAAQRHGVDVRTVQRGLAAAGVARPRGRPAEKKPAEAGLSRGAA